MSGKLFGDVIRKESYRSSESNGAFPCEPSGSSRLVNRLLHPRQVHRQHGHLPNLYLPPFYLRRSLLVGLVVAVGFWMTGAGATPVPESAAPGTSCVGLDPPVEGRITAGFEPGPGYEGHWGVDYPLGPDGAVRAAADGEVSFSGWVVGNLAVTLDHGGGLKTSYSYLDSSLVKRGQSVNRGMVIGRADGDSPHDGLHFSVRIHGTYIDPETVVGCLPVAPTAGLRLVQVPITPGGRR